MPIRSFGLRPVVTFVRDTVQYANAAFTGRSIFDLAPSLVGVAEVAAGRPLQPIDVADGRRLVGVVTAGDLSRLAEKEPDYLRIEVASVMSATGSFDHRAIDGADGAQLMQAFKDLVENPLGLVA